MPRSGTLLNAYGIEPLSAVCARTVRFEEIDPMGIMWHGRYASWLEDGRETLGNRYGISYRDFYQHGFVTPIKKFSLDYVHPLIHDQTYEIHTFLLWSDSARMDFQYSIMDKEGTIMTQGKTTQLFMTTNGKLLLDFPTFYQDFMARWKNGDLA
ncbi:MAG: acyl-CoA thioesterase [Desulfovibrionaceae bacterium]|nr:acyl-CoA thioesterase [Desulfovibrionaceae bacterium]